jgi:pimeloyl-ACP methyl ester carboxylesterase
MPGAYSDARVVPSPRKQDVEAYKTASILRELLALLEAVGAPKTFTLVGHDWGASLAWAMTATAPERWATGIRCEKYRVMKWNVPVAKCHW